MDSIEKAKQYKQDKVLEKQKAKDLLKREKARIASSRKVSNLTKKVSQGKSIKTRKKKTQTRSQLVKKYDAVFSQYIRLRDADKNGICSCITCGAKVHWKNIQC
jgi:hypothetical protein